MEEKWKRRKCRPRCLGTLGTKGTVRVNSKVILFERLSGLGSRLLGPSRTIIQQVD